MLDGLYSHHLFHINLIDKIKMIINVMLFHCHIRYASSNWLIGEHRVAVNFDL